MFLLSPEEVYYRIEDFLVESVRLSPKMFDIQGSLREASLEIIVPDRDVVSPLERFITDILEAPVDCFDVTVLQDWSTPGSRFRNASTSLCGLSCVSTISGNHSSPVRLRNRV